MAENEVLNQRAGNQFKLTPEIENFPAFEELESSREPTPTYKMNADILTVNGGTDGIEAMKQAVFKILSTERFQYPMYSADYGIELNDLYGQPPSYVCPELERRISEALSVDERIEGTENFSFDIGKKGCVSARFTVNTIFGSFETEKTVITDQ